MNYEKRDRLFTCLTLEEEAMGKEEPSGKQGWLLAWSQWGQTGHVEPQSSHYGNTAAGNPPLHTIPPIIPPAESTPHPFCTSSIRSNGERDASTACLGMLWTYE